MTENRATVLGLLAASTVPPFLLGARALTTAELGLTNASDTQAFLTIVLFIFVVSALLALVVGYPLFLLLRHIRYVCWWSAVLVGGLAGTLYSGFIWARHSSIELLAFYSILGMVSGLTFWLVYRLAMAGAAHTPTE